MQIMRMTMKYKTELGATIKDVNRQTNKVFSKSFYKMQEFKKFLLSGSLLGTAIGVVIGASFSGFVKAFVSLIFGIFSFLTTVIFGKQHEMKWHIIPLEEFLQSLGSLLLIAGAVFFFLQLVNNILAKDKTERFGYDARLEEISQLHQEQKETNALLKQLIEQNQTKGD